ncbi:MAG: hypothetical protein ACLFPL_04530 [Candidatus Nanoarchaeia archaeon]
MKILNPLILFEKAQDYNSGPLLVDFQDELVINLLNRINKDNEIKRVFTRDGTPFKTEEFEAFTHHPTRTTT